VASRKNFEKKGPLPLILQPISKPPMPQDKNRQFLDFERPIKDLFDDIEELKTKA
jgi:hypothetical protein